MRSMHWLMVAILGLPIVGCGDGPTTAPSSSPAPTALKRNTLSAPAGGLRVALHSRTLKRRTRPRIGTNDGGGI